MAVRCHGCERCGDLGDRTGLALIDRALRGDDVRDDAPRLMAERVGVRRGRMRRRCCGDLGDRMLEEGGGNPTPTKASIFGHFQIMTRTVRGQQSSKSQQASAHGMHIRARVRVTINQAAF